MAFCGQCGTKSNGGAFCTECGSEIASSPEKNNKAKPKQDTPLSVRASILAELWIEHKDDPDYKDFVEYNDLGLPLAYAVDHGIVEMNNQITMFVNETFDVLLVALGIEEDLGFEELGELLVVSQE